MLPQDKIVRKLSFIRSSQSVHISKDREKERQNVMCVKKGNAKEKEKRNYAKEEDRKVEISR